ncbi:MAG: hypothetical protein OQK35_01785 [Alphaproteobacteria bacterium]|nr:hypothetical protein [Rhodospirillales bacterium]MCW9045039.1 hypothetical protein [Alphaproteobacteria bacterium]
MANQPLFILLCSGTHEKIQIAGMTAAVAAVSERPVYVLVTMNAILSFKKGAESPRRYTGGAFSKLLLDKKAPDAIELFGQGKMLGDLTMYACTMALDLLEWDMNNLTEDLFDEALGLTKFLSDAEDGQLMTL